MASNVATRRLLARKERRAGCQDGCSTGSGIFCGARHVVVAFEIRLLTGDAQGTAELAKRLLPNLRTLAN